MRRTAATLIEVMVVVVVLGVMASLAVPNLLPLRDTIRVSGNAGRVAGILDEMRRRAIADGRCYRVRLPTAASLVVERRTSSDCRNLNLDGWEAIRTFPLTEVSLSLETLPVASGDDRLVFRPNGRLRGDDDLLPSEEAARFVVALPSGGPARSLVTVTALGRICAATFNGALPTFSAPASCP